MPHVVPPPFVESAKKILHQLTKITGPAFRMREEAEELLNLFEGWERKPPESAEERTEAIRRLIGLHRRATEFFVKNRLR